MEQHYFYQLPSDYVRRTGKTMNNKTGSIPFLILMVISMIAWGGCWTSAKMIAGISSPQVLVFWRYIFTALSLIPILLIRKESLKIDRSALLTIFLSAIFMVAYSQCFFKGLEKGLAGAGGVLLTTINPIFTYILGVILLRRKIHTKERLGLFFGLFGGILQLQLWSVNFTQLLQSGNLYFLISAFMWSFVALLSYKAQKNTSVFVYSLYLNGSAALLSALFVKSGEITSVFSFPPIFWYNILYLSLIGTTFATTAYFYSTRKLGTSKASSFIFLVPINAVILSFIFLKEIPRWTTVIGGASAIFAVFLINKKER